MGWRIRNARCRRDWKAGLVNGSDTTGGDDDVDEAEGSRDEEEADAGEEGATAPKSNDESADEEQEDAAPKAPVASELGANCPVRAMRRGAADRLPLVAPAATPGLSPTSTSDSGCGRTLRGDNFVADPDADGTTE